MDASSGDAKTDLETLGTPDIFQDTMLLEACDSRPRAAADGRRTPPSESRLTCTWLASWAAPNQTKSAMKISSGSELKPRTPKRIATPWPIVAATWVARA